MRKTSFLLLLGLLLPLGADADQGALPLGDGKVASAPAPGYIYSCQQQFNGGGAFRDGSWIAGESWYPDRKIHVRGDVAWPSGDVGISVENGRRLIRASGLPDHETGEFPVQPSDPAYQYDRNPNSIRANAVLLDLPADPQIAATASCLPMGMIGVSLGGVAIFNGLDAGGRDAVAHEIQDKCDGHPQPEGQYHYHGYSHCMKEADAGANGHSGLIGYALDGFGIYGEHGEGGADVTDAALDACHGHTHEVIWNGKKQVIYHYHMTREYPYSLGCFKGTPVTSRRQARGQGGQGGQGGPQGGPGQIGQGEPQGGRADHERILNEAAATLGVDPDRLRQAVGPPPPDFARAAQMLGLSEAQVRDAFDKARQQP